MAGAAPLAILPHVFEKFFSARGASGGIGLDCTSRSASRRRMAAT
jgi:hypothetical protein